MPRPRKYDWDDKRDICHKLSVEEGLSASQIVKWFANHFKLPESELPRTNQFYQKFREWGFPTGRDKRSAEQQERLVARTRELFEQHLPAEDIQKKLNEEGWNLNKYKFRVLRKKHGMLMRSNKGYESRSKPVQIGKKRKRGEEEDGDGGDDVDGETVDVEDDEQAGGEVDDTQSSEPAPLSPEEEARRAKRLADLQLQSDELLRTRKRRRRIRGWGHLPADEPGMAPRHLSETSLDECKVYLGLNNDLYSQIRRDYKAICEDMGIMKMSDCVEGQWQASKDRLVLGNPHLSAVLHPLQPDLDQRANALNCICSDVTKRMRIDAKAMTIAEAGTVLGLDPAQSKELRRVFYQILVADHFTTALACGQEHYTELREKWYDTSDVLREAVSSGDARKARAVELLCRDARKRYCDDQLSKDPSKKQWQKSKPYGFGPGPANGRVTGKSSKKNAGTTSTDNTATNPTSVAPEDRLKTMLFSNSTNSQRRVLVGPGWFGRPHEIPNFDTSTDNTNGTAALAINHDGHQPLDFDLDPLLAANTHGPIWPPTDGGHTPAPPAPATATATTIPAYFRLAPNSHGVGNHPSLWLGRLALGNAGTPNFDALRRAATAKAGAAAGPVRLGKVNGVMKNADGTEDSWLIETDEELGVYLGEAGEKAMFIVLLEGQ